MRYKRYCILFIPIIPTSNENSCLQTMEALRSCAHQGQSDFRHGPLRYACLFFIPICFPCDVCCCYYLHLPHQIIYLLCPVLKPDCRPRVCVNVYRFSQGFISIAPIAMAIDILFNCPICADIFFLILELINLVAAWGFSETLHEKSNPISDISV